MLKKLICKTLLTGAMLMAASVLAAGTSNNKAEDATPKENPRVILQTSMGSMTVELYPNKAPATVKNFLAYVDSGFYDDVIFHRIIDNFMVQTGGFTKGYTKKRTRAPIVNESSNGLANARGTLSMARTGDPDSATAQFFINLANNPNLDFKPGRLGMPDQQGYAVFGKVIKGIEAIDKMAAQPQGKHRASGRGQFVNAPNEQITIDKAFRVQPKQDKIKPTK